MIIVHADFEENVMENDLSRIDLSKVEANKAEPYPLAKINVTIANQSAVDVFTAQTRDRFLDYEVPFEADIGPENKAFLCYVDNTKFEFDLTEGHYTLQSLLSMIETQFNVQTGVTTSWDLDEFNKLTVSWTTGQKIKLDLKNSPILNNLGFRETMFRPLVDSSELEARLVNNLPVKVVVEAITEDPDNAANTNSNSKTYYLNVYNEKFSGVLATDSELKLIENDILRWVPEGKNTYKTTHLQVVNDIVEWFSRKSYVNIYEEKFVISDFLREDELKYWAKYQALYYIFNSNQNQTDDVFEEKAKDYKQKANKHRRRIFRVDLDANDILDFDEVLVSNSIKMIRY